MAATVNNIQTAGTFSGGPSGITIANYVVPAGNNQVLVAIAKMTSQNASGDAITGVSFGAQAMTEAVSAVHSGTSETNALVDIRVFYLDAPNGTANVVMSLNDNAPAVQLVAFTLNDAEQGGPSATGSDNTDTASPYNANITTVDDDSLVVAGVGYHGNTGFVPNSGQTEHADFGGANSAMAVGSIVRATAGAYTDEWTSSRNEEAAQVLAAWSPAAAGGVTVAPGPSSAVAARTGPQVVLESMSITPGLASGIGAVGHPAVVQSSVALTPGPAPALAAARDPSVGALVIAPALAGVTAAVVAPGVVLGGLALTPAPRALHATTEQPSVATTGGAIVTPTPSSAVAATRIPSGAVGDSGVTFGMDFPIAAGTAFPVLEQPVYIGGGFR